jgi:hypothetical protein
VVRYGKMEGTKRREIKISTARREGTGLII